MTAARVDRLRCDDLSDVELLAGCVRREAAAIEALIERFQLPVFRFVGRLIASDGADRDDLVQATFIEVIGAASKFRGLSSVKVWIFGIAANRARNHIRGTMRRRTLELEVARLDPAPSPSPAVFLEQRELAARLARAIAKLPDHLREVFVLCDLEEVSGVEVARVLDLREGTVWRRLHEARKALRAALGGAQ